MLSLERLFGKNVSGDNSIDRAKRQYETILYCQILRVNTQHKSNRRLDTSAWK